MKKQSCGVATILLAFLIMAGCSGIREVETGSPAPQKQRGRVVYISEEKALAALSKTQEVMDFQNSVKDNCVFITEQTPTNSRPVYIIRVTGDAGDHIDTLNSFKIDARTGKIIDKQF
ncbi:MAG: PepSY domain-containing protein [Ignavibacteriales bacterium]